MVPPPLLALALLLSPPHLAALPVRLQEPAVGVRVASVGVEPEQPEFGGRFDLRLTFRVGPGLVLVLPDSLLPSEAVAGAGPPQGRTESPALGDSTDVSVTYSAIALAAGGADLPSLEVELQPFGIIQELDLGQVSIEPFAWPGGVDEVPQARPAKDVVGGSWSVWDALVGSVIAVASTIGIGLVVSNVAARRREARARAELGTPRERALRELQRVHSLTWHRAGRVPEFYEACTAAVRRYWADSEPKLGIWLTSTELMSRLPATGQSGDVLRPVEVVVQNAEQVKFGRHDLQTETAERDWRVVHTWISGMPEP